MMQAQVMNNANRGPMMMANQQGAGQTRLDRWLGGEAPSPAPQPVQSSSAPKLIQITEEMLSKLKPEQILQITMNNLPIIGHQIQKEFVSKLPAGHSLKSPQSFNPMPIKSAPYLGSCKIGHVIQGREGDRVYAKEFFMSTFDADIDLSGKTGELYLLKDRKISNQARMVYGINTISRIETDGQGRSRMKTMAFNVSEGDRGVVFKTNSKEEALYELAAASLGLTVEEFRARMAPRR